MEEENRRELDEKSLIVEQARLEKEKKRRKNRRKKRIAWAVVFVAAAGGLWYFFWGRKMDTGQAAAVKIEKASGQEIVYARLDSVKGNEIVYTVAEEDGQQEDGRQADGQQKQAESDQAVPGGRSADGSSAELPDGLPEDMAQAGSMGQGGSFSFSGGMSADAAVRNGFTYDGKQFGLTEETGAAVIPVGTAVTTRLGTVTTFSRLQAGDYVALIMESGGNDREIAAVYILG